MRIGVAVDGSPASRAGAALVMALPLGPSDSLRVISIARPIVMPNAWAFGHTSGAAAYVCERVESTLGRAHAVTGSVVRRLRSLACPVAAIVRWGDPFEELKSVVIEEDLDLLVVGCGGTGALGPFGHRSVTRRLLRDMPTSILVARATVGPLQRALIVADGSSSGPAVSPSLRGFPLPPGAEVQVFVAAAPERDGDQRRDILDAAMALDADLIVIGAQGDRGLKGLVHGSLAQDVGRTAPCSVLVLDSSRAPGIPPATS